MSEYYKHPQMGDGHLNKCKPCTKKDVSKREKYLYANDKEWVKKERKRGRDKFFRLEYGDKYKPTKESKSKTTKSYKERYPEKEKARNRAQHLTKTKGLHLHHWSYNIEHAKDCIELSTKEHHKLHRYMTYDQNHKMYRDESGNLLDTREKHLAYYNSLSNKE